MAIGMKPKLATHAVVKTGCIDNLFRKKTRGADSIEGGGIPKIHRRLGDMSLRAQSVP